MYDRRFAAIGGLRRSGIRSPAAGGGAADLAQQILDAYTAAGWTVHFLGLVRSAADVDTVSGGVATWYDLSGNGNDATQATAGARPTYSATAINSLPGFTLDGGDFLRTGTIDVSASAAFAMTTVFRDTNTAARVPAEYGDGAANPGGMMLRTNLGGAGELRAQHRNTAFATAESALSYPMTSAGCVTITADIGLATSEAAIRHNGSDVTATRAADGNNTAVWANSTLTIGARNDAGASSGMAGAIAAHVFASGAGPISGSVLTAISDVEALLQTQWGI